MIRKLLLWAPFALIAGLLAMFYIGLRNPSDHAIASQMVGEALPEFSAGPAIAELPGLSSADFADGKPRLLNVFASWCVPCVDEVPVLARMQAQGAEINGIAIHDTSAELTAFLQRNGNPYARIGLDEGGRAQIAFGASGVPETFVVDGNGMILYQHIGAVTDQDAPRLMAMLEEAR